MKRLAWLVLVVVGGCIVQQHRFDNAEDHYTTSTPVATSGVTLKMQKILGGVSVQGMVANQEPLPGAEVVYDSEPVHRVYITGFEISSECIDNATYGKCVANGKCPALPPGGNVDSAMAAAFCKWGGMRLPTEAELELAVRGYDGATTLADVNPFGLKTCGTGDVGQWVADGYRCDAYVGRAWGNPLAMTTVPMYRLFSAASNPTALLAARLQGVKAFSFRCARTIDSSGPPLAPVQPACAGNCKVTGLAVGDRFGCALRADGSVWCWGSNGLGQLGTGDVFDAMPASRARPIGIGGAVAEIAAGSAFACARTVAGQVTCWGDNSAGQIAGSTLPKESKPFAVADGAIGLAVAGSHGCVVLQDQSVSCWGHGGAEPAGLGPTQVTASGISGATAIAAGPRSACAIVGDHVRCWGMVHDPAGKLDFVAPAVALSYSVTATALALGDGHSCAVVDKTVQCWGDRSHWGGTGIASVPETVSTAIGTPRVFASATGTLVLDQGASAVNVNTGFPIGLPSDGVALSFSTAPGGGGCATEAGGVTCFGIERGQLGRSNGCTATAASSILYLP